MIQFMYFSSRRVNRRLMYHLHTSIAVRQRTYTENKERSDSCSKLNKLIKYPDYKIIYTLPYIKYVSTLNATKRNLTILTGVSIPTIVGLQMLDFISEVPGLTIVSVSCTFTLWLHIILYMCNNLVGFVYFKEEDQKVILSYSNYWGKRVDLETTPEDIQLLTDIPFNIFNMGIINIESYKQNLKISMKYGQIIEQSHFRAIFGISK